MEVLDLRHFTARQLRPLLEEESHIWEQRLKWDYRASTELLLEYLDGRVLPGYAATENGEMLGYTFCVYEGVKAVVGDAFSFGYSGAALETTRALLHQLLDLLQHLPQVERIESQLLLYSRGVVTAPFEEHGFRVYPRLFMECELSNTGLRVDGASVPAGLMLTRWSPECYQGAAELVHAAYREHLDGEINDQYRSLHGSLRFLHNIVRFPGCGVFDAEASWVLRDEAGVLKGMVLCSRVREDMGHITQLCVSRELRGQGLGRILMRHCAAGLARRGFRGMSLTVTEDNCGAVQLYKGLGFSVGHEFEAMVWESAKE